MLSSTTPDHLKFSAYLDRFADRRRAPKWSFGRVDIGSAWSSPGGAPYYEPGQYRIDRDFPSNRRADVRKGRLTDSLSAPDLTFGSENRVGAHGTLKGISSPNNRKTNPLGPGHYAAIDSTDKAHRAHWPSVPAWSMSKGKDQGNVREEQRSRSSYPGPGKYDVPSRFDEVSRSRQEGFERLVKRESTCRWEGQFSHIFRSIHASARQGPSKGPSQCLG